MFKNYYPIMGNTKNCMKKFIYYKIILFVLLIFSCNNPVIAESPGCTDRDACNYNLQFNLDDGSCQYPIGNYNCDGNCVATIDCSGICGGDVIEDECGVCGGDGIGNYDCDGNCITELDCAGVCGGNAIEDECNVCDGGIENINECACPSGVIDECGVCDGDNSSCTDCDGVINGRSVIDCDNNCCDPDWPFGSLGFDGIACYRIDVCENCGDFLSANECQDDCKDCNDICGGDAIEDCAGECGGSATEDCTGECGGNSIEDECGVCSDENLDSQYALVWEDDFEDDELDLGKWNIEEWATGTFNEEEQAYTDATDNIFLSNGQLHIRALRETYDPDGDGVVDALYTSGRITTKHKGDWQYAKVEARAKLPIGNGTWPAIWMLPTENIYGDWPSSGEIDIMEFVGKDPGKTHSSIHNATYYTELDPNHPENDGMSQHQTSSINIDYVDNWHLYSMIWSKNRIIFYVDDEEVLIYDNLDTGFELWPFDQQFFLVLNLAIGGTWGGEVEPDIFPVEFVIDYVKVFQKSCGL